MAERTEVIDLRLTPQELALIKQRMDEAGMKNMSAYLREMAMYGNILRIDIPEFRKMLRLLGNTTGNINQIAKRAKATDNVYAADLEEISKLYGALHEETKAVQQQISDLIK